MTLTISRLWFIYTKTCNHPRFPHIQFIQHSKTVNSIKGSPRFPLRIASWQSFPITLKKSFLPWIFQMIFGNYHSWGGITMQKMTSPRKGFAWAAVNMEWWNTSNLLTMKRKKKVCGTCKKFGKHSLNSHILQLGVNLYHVKYRSYINKPFNIYLFVVSETTLSKNAIISKPCTDL